MAQTKDRDDTSSTRSKDTLLGNTSRRIQYETIEISDEEDAKTHHDDSSITSKDYGDSKLGSLNLTVLTICSYTLCSLVTMPTAGKLSDAFGRKPVLVTLCILFLIGSIGCGYAESFMQVIVARAIAGFGGGGLPLLANVIIHDVVPSEKRSSYQSYISTIQTLGFALGAPIGGFIADTLGWRYCFKVNILPLLIALYVYGFHLPNYPLNSNEELSVKEKLRRVDFLGIFFLSFGTWSFMCAFLLGGNTYAWDSPFVLSALGSAACSFILFAVHQNYWSKYPLLARAAYGDRNFAGACLGMFLIGSSESGAVLIIPQFVMGVLDFSTYDTGVWLMIESIAIPVGCFVAGRYMQQTGRFYWFALFNVAMYIVGLTILYNWIGQNIEIIGGTAGIIVQGVGYGAAVVPLLVAVSSTIANELAATALSMYMLTRSVGYLTGVGITTALIQGNLKALLVKRIEGPDAEEIMIII
ncbi:major facilitator superfamily domain-containing protein [Fennellomyces sp. T-0311]|nr:major facilitator superfamily domain-containing protein [Fennellomyces sp. T-0311]